MINSIHVSRSTHDIAIATYYNLKGSYILYRTEPRRIDGRSIRRLFSADAIDCALRGLLQASGVPRRWVRKRPQG